MKKENFNKASEINESIEYLEGIISNAQSDKSKIIIKGFIDKDMSLHNGMPSPTAESFFKEVQQTIIRKAKERKSKLEKEFDKL